MNNTMNNNMMGRSTNMATRKLQSTTLPDPFGFTSTVPNNMMTMQNQRRIGMGNTTGMMGMNGMNGMNGTMNGMMNNNPRNMRATNRDDFGI
jgi:hypothetical protein